MTAASSTPHRVVVIGHGMVGHRFVAELARGVEQSARSGRPIDVAVTVLGAEPYEPYNRLLLSEVLAGRAEERTAGGAATADRMFRTDPVPWCWVRF